MNVIARRAAIISLSRIANQGLMLLSPIILVRLLPIEEFGRYREFLLHATVLIALAGFYINSSLLVFVPSRPGQTWRLVRQCVLMVAVISAVTIAGVLAANGLANGTLLGDFALTSTIYVICYTNVDFWEYLWLAQKRSVAVLAYSSSRLVMRMAVVIGVAALTQNVQAIIVTLLCLEGVRLFVSWIAWRREQQLSDEIAAPQLWREHWRYCLPVGLATVLTMLASNVTGLMVDHTLGHVALAFFSIAAYSFVLMEAVRNSLSDILLPELSQTGGTNMRRLELWQRSVVIYAILLIPMTVVLLRYATELLGIVFKPEFAAAAPLLQVYALMFLRECFDFDLALRALNRTRTLLCGHLISLATSIVLFLILVPKIGLVGAGVSLLVARLVNAAFLYKQLARSLQLPVAKLAPWRRYGKVVLSAAVAALVLVSNTWTEHLGAGPGVIVSAALFTVCFFVLLRIFKVPEANYFLQFAVRKAVPRAN
jgi:O-antigen/teichoic acid export membrane protein